MRPRAHQGRLAEERLVRVLLGPSLDDELGRVEADIVGELERAHRVAGAELHGGVNVGGGGVAALEHAHGLEHVGDEEAVDDEAGGVLAGDGVLAEG